MTQGCPKSSLPVLHENKVRGLVGKSQSVDARYSHFNDVHNGHQINNHIQGTQTNHTTINHHTQRSTQYSDKERLEFADWLSPLNFRQTQSEVHGIWREGTGEWVLENEKFKEWQRGDAKTLWCPGIPGSGKTVLASSIIHHLEKKRKRDAAVVYTYCSYKEHSSQTVHNLIASFLKQLVQDFPLTFERISDKFKRHREQNFRPTLLEVRDILIDEIKQYSQVFIVVDALDEVPEDDETRYELLRCLQSLGGSLLVTSRDMASIGTVLHDALRMDICAHKDDVHNYIIDRIRLGTRLDRLLDDALRVEVVERLTMEAQGMFLLSRLHVDSLALKATRGEVRVALNNLPKEMSGAYDETMKRIDGARHGELAKKAITWIVFAKRPLLFAELQEAIALSAGLRDLGTDDLVDKATLIEACAGLLVADRENDVCRLVHYSTQEYLENRGDWAFPDPQAQITNLCIDALSILSPKEAHPGKLPHVPKFSVYARQNWGHHAREHVGETNLTAIHEF